jgi:ribosomal protein L37AE/L43A
VFILVAAPSVSFDWSTGAQSLELISIVLLGGSYAQMSRLAPVFLNIGLPIGALVFLIARPRSLALIADAAPESDVAVDRKLNEIVSELESKEIVQCRCPACAQTQDIPVSQPPDELVRCEKCGAETEFQTWQGYSRIEAAGRRMPDSGYVSLVGVNTPHEGVPRFVRCSPSAPVGRKSLIV